MVHVMSCQNPPPGGEDAHPAHHHTRVPNLQAQLRTRRPTSLDPPMEQAEWTGEKGVT